MFLERIRILILDVPRMLREIIEEVLAGQSDMAVVGEFSSTDAVVEAVDRTHADLVIGGAAARDRLDVARLLATFPRLKLLLVGVDARDTELHELQPRVVPLGELSPQTLLESIRRAFPART